jgi:hypothetical protein
MFALYFLLYIERESIDYRDILGIRYNLRIIIGALSILIFFLISICYICVYIYTLSYHIILSISRGINYNTNIIYVNFRCIVAR